MPVRVQRRYEVVRDGARASLTTRCEQREEVLSTVRLALALVEAVLAEILAAVRAEEVIRVPCTIEGGHALLCGGLL